MSNDAELLSDSITTRTAGSLPSQRTKDACLRAPLESDNIDEVKAALIHIWLHYEALELTLADRDTNYETLQKTHEAIKSGILNDDVQNWDKTITHGFNDALIEFAYDQAHLAGQLVQVLGDGNFTNALQQFGFGHLDYSDPELNKFSDEDLAKLSGQVPEDDEEADK